MSPLRVGCTRGVPTLRIPVDKTVTEKKVVTTLADEQTGVPDAPDPIRAEAEKRVKQRTELIRHIGTYLIINGFLVVVWALTGAGYPWFLWVMAGWGIGLLFHIVDYFSGRRGSASRERMVEKEMEKMKKGGG